MEVLPEVSFEHSIPCEVVILSHVFLVSTASAQEFCSVGDDSCLILWDARTGSSPVVKVAFILLMLIICLFTFFSRFVLFLSLMKVAKYNSLVRLLLFWEAACLQLSYIAY